MEEHRILAPRRACAVALSLAALTLAAGPARAQVPEAVELSLDSLLNVQINTSAKYAQTVTEAASSVTIVTADDIERYGYRTVADVLGAVSGFYGSYDRVGSFVGTRGFGRPSDYNGRILLLLDGNTLNDGLLSTAMIGSELVVPLSSLERIEIVRGPGSALYGTGAMFAVVNLVSKSAAVLAGGDVALGTGSYGQRSATLTFGHTLRDGTGFTFAGTVGGSDGQDLYFAEFDSPATDNGVAHNLDWERFWSVSGSATRGDVTLRARYSNRLKGVPTAYYGSDFNRSADDRARLASVDVAYARSLNAFGELAVRGYANYYGLDARAPYYGHEFTVVGRDVALGGEAAVHWDLASANRLTAGAEVRRHVQARLVVPLFDGTAGEIRAPFTIASAYLQDEYQVTPALRLLGGIRYEYYSTVQNVITPRAAVIFAPTTRTNLKLLFGEGLRAPNVLEANAERLFYGVSGDVDREEAQTTELVWQQRIGAALLGTLSLYRYHVNGLIDPIIDTSGFTTRYANTGHIDAEGVEATVEARHGRAAGYGNYTYQRARGDDAEAPLTNSPTHLIKAGVGFDLLPWLRPAAEARHESSRRTLYGTETDPFTVANVRLVLGRREHADGSGPSWRRARLALRVNNVFNTSYAFPGGAQHVQVAFPQDGRNLEVELGYEF